MVLVGGCEPYDSGTLIGPTDTPAPFDIEPPLPLLLSRAIDSELLVLEVRVDAEPIAVERTDDDRWQGTVRVVPGGYTTIAVNWSYLNLPVASSEREVPVASNASSVAVTFNDSEYDTTADSDGDDRSNLAEFDAESDPRSSADPGVAVPSRPLLLRFDLPRELEGLSNDVLSDLAFAVTVNGDSVDSTREFNRWKADTTVPEGSRPYIVATLYADSSRSTRLARRAIGDRDVGFGRLVSVLRDEYRTEYDDDFDGIENISAFVTMTEQPADGMADDLESSLDDADNDGLAAEADINDTDPCAPDPDAQACVDLSLDTDGDGELDSVEGDSDEDGDGQLDRFESALDDADNDGTVDQADPDDSDPCVPEPAQFFC